MSVREQRAPAAPDDAVSGSVPAQAAPTGSSVATHTAVSIAPTGPAIVPPVGEPMAPAIDEAAARRAMNAKTKPLGALGRLEEAAIRLAILQQTLQPMLERTRVCVFAADHGVTEEGVSAYPRAVTAEMVRTFDRGGAAINVIAKTAGVELEVIDVGVDHPLTGLTRIRHEKVRAGSRNLLHEPAMSMKEFEDAQHAGAAAARRAAADGVRALGLGEMGIGNTTAAAAVLTALTGVSPELTVGRGTGVDDEALARKRAVVERAVRLHLDALPAAPPADELLRRLGGLELAAMAGAAREAAKLGLAVVADGFISTVAILCALRDASGSTPAGRSPLRAAVFFSHRSAERGHTVALEACAMAAGCDARPLLDLDMRLGEGTGAALAMPVLRAAAAVMRDMATFESAGVSAGDHADEHSEQRIL